MLSDKITATYQSAFASCKKLTDVYYLGTPEDRENITKYGTSYLEDVQWHYNFQFGDTNCDGKINATDLSKLKTGLLSNNDASCDINADGIINIIDLLRLKRYLAGCDVTLGKDN